jgi:polar amino acid transport system substrate-binding protein
LEKLTVAMKRGAYYFERFNKNRKIRKLELNDDDNMVKMFRAGRFDTMIINDKKALESALKKHNITEYSFAKYTFYRKMGNYYGIAPNHPARERLQKAIEEMIKTGRIDEIYSKYGVTPPLHY